MQCGLRLAYTSRLPETARHGTFMVEHISAVLSQEVYTAENDNDNVTMILDSGCRRSVAGEDWHSAMHQACREKGLRPVRRSINESFKFGDGDEVPAGEAYVYPAGVLGHKGELDVAVVDRSCPGLMSRKAMQDLGIAVDFGAHSFSCRAAGVSKEKLQFSHSGHPVVSVTDWRENLTGIPRRFCQDKFDMSEGDEALAPRKMTWYDEEPEEQEVCEAVPVRNLAQGPGKDCSEAAIC